MKEYSMEHNKWTDIRLGKMIGIKGLNKMNEFQGNVGYKGTVESGN